MNIYIHIYITNHYKRRVLSSQALNGRETKLITDYLRNSQSDLYPLTGSCSRISLFCRSTYDVSKQKMLGNYCSHFTT